MKPAVRKTVARPAALTGVGLHSGATVRLNILPAESGGGVRFVRMDLPGRPEVRLGDVSREAPPFRSVLKRGEAEVHTVEHLLAACHVLGLTDAAVEIDGPEVPGMDGSALPFALALLDSGLKELPGAGVEPLCVSKPLSAGRGEAQIEAAPDAEGLAIRYALHYPDAPLAQGVRELRIDAATFLKEIAPARTFCMKREAEALRAAGFGKGANTQNTVVVDGDRAVDTALRFPDEPVRHKILDLIGDLYLLGRPVRGAFRAERSGHALNRELLLALAGAEKE